MEGNRGRATKTTIFAAIFLAFLMLGVPSLSTSGTLGVADNASAVAGDRALRIGIVGMTGSISTLNPLLYTMAEEMFAIWPCYSTMLQHDVNAKLIGDLVKTYTISPDGLTWDFKLVSTATWYDKNKVAAGQPLIPVTARDVIYTYSMISNESTNNLYSYFPKVGGVPILQSMSQGATPYDLRIVLATQYAPFVGALTGLPILPRYIWINYYDPPNHKNAWNWQNFDTGVAAIVGSGPWYYNLAGLPSTGVVELDKSPTWFQTEERGWVLRPNKLILKSELSPDSNLADMQNGGIDIMEWVLPSQYGGALSTLPGTTRFASSTGFVYEYNLNQMTDAMRSSLGGKFTSGGAYNNQLLLDPIVKQAIAESVNKWEFINVTYNGLGQPADSLLPYAHPYHYAYGVQPPAGRAPPGETPIPYDPVGARALLMSAGWKYRADGTQIGVGDPDYSDYYPLYKQGATSPLRFRFCTLAESPEWDIGGRLLVDYAKAVGVDIEWDYTLKSTNQMNGIWASADYDMWLWDWVFTPVSEVSVDVLEVMATEAIGSWSDIYWSDATYDALYNESLVTMDPAARMVITDEMQRLAYENMGCQMLAYRADLFAARTVGPDNWQNWGDWSTQWVLEPSQLYPWLYLRIQPQDNHAPTISTSSTYDAVVGSGVTMTASATDNNQMEYRWFYGDGESSTWQTSPATTHTYTKDGYYTAYVAAREVDGLDHFVSVTETEVTAVDLSNTPPTNVDFTFAPSNPNTGTMVYLNGTATDSPGDTLYYSWNFGDGSSATGQNVTHQFKLGSSSVTLSVDDHHLGTGTRPTNRTKLVPVTANSPPTISVPSTPIVYPRTPTPFTVTWSDPDTADSHRFTWDWGDGSMSVTSTATDTHTYTMKGTLEMTVYIDDLTTLPGHNVSGVGLNTIYNPANKQPVFVSFTANGSATSWSTLTDTEVNFSAKASDADGDVLGYTFDFGDGTFAYANATQNVEVSVQHSFTTSDIYDTYVTITDYQAVPVNGGPVTIDVAPGNAPPVVDRPSPGSFYGTMGSPIDFAAWANDSDSGDTLTYWWDFGDGTYGSGQTIAHTFADVTGSSGTPYRVWVNDNNGSNVSSLPSVAVINAIPDLSDLPLLKAGAGESTMYTAVASDMDAGDTLTYTWDFGDGSGPVSGNDVMHTYTTAPTNYTISVTVDDGYVDDFGVSHSVTKTTTVAVVPFALHLVSGWNFVTIPTILNGYKASNIGLMTGDVVAGWNPATKVYDKNFIVGVSPPPLDFAIAGSTGYWIHTGVAETLYLYGTVPTTTQSRAVTLPAGGGWFIAGFNTLSTSMMASNVPGMYTGGVLNSVAAYDPSTGTYKTYIAGVPPTDFALAPGQAYWCYATASGTLAYNP